MPTFYLEPRKGDTTDPSWEASSLMEGCWTEADSEELARRQVEQATFKRTSQEPGAECARSPWAQQSLVQCKLDQAQGTVPSSQVLSKSGKIIDIPIVPTSA
jgi:hypothetical protein